MSPEISATVHGMGHSTGLLTVEAPQVQTVPQSWLLLVKYSQDYLIQARARKGISGVPQGSIPGPSHFPWSCTAPQLLVTDSIECALTNSSDSTAQVNKN